MSVLTTSPSNCFADGLPGQPVTWFEYYYTPVNDESSSASGVLFNPIPSSTHPPPLATP
jgi:hypothetical protein